MHGNVEKQILPYFPEMTPGQTEKMEKLQQLYEEWNPLINVISRKDIDNLYERHVLHSLTIAKFVRFKPGSYILDLGTGGGMPGIPLAILFPEVSFKLIDARAKKIKVVQDIAARLKLDNVKAQHLRVEDEKEKFDFVVSRAVAPVDKLVNWSRNVISKKHKNAIPNGLICLKGGDLKKELKILSKNTYYEIEKIENMVDNPYYEEKVLIYVQL